MYTTAAKVRELIPQASADNPDTTAIEAQISRAEATHVDPYLRKVWDVPFTSPDDIVVEMSAFFSAALTLLAYVRGSSATEQAEEYMKIGITLRADVLRDPTMLTQTPATSTKASRDKAAGGISPAEGEGSPAFGLGDETTWGKP